MRGSGQPKRELAAAAELEAIPFSFESGSTRGRGEERGRNCPGVCDFCWTGQGVGPGGELLLAKLRDE